MSDDLEGAIRRLSEQVGALQTEVRALDRRSALPPSPPSEPALPAAYAWVDALEAPARRRPQLPRVVLEGLFLCAVAIASAVHSQPRKWHWR